MEIGGIIKLRQSQILPSFQDSFVIGQQNKKKKNELKKPLEKNKSYRIR